jgi:plasmid stabilization system protein ParE
VKALRYLPGIRDHLHLLPPTARIKVKAALEDLAGNRKGGLDVKGLRGDFRRPLERLKVGSWRVAFYQEKHIYVIRVFPRTHGYDWLAQWET